jgi:hypothetical protein
LIIEDFLKTLKIAFFDLKGTPRRVAGNSKGTIREELCCKITGNSIKMSTAFL